MEFESITFTTGTGNNKKINGLEVKIYRVCSGVKGMSVKNQKKYRKELKSKGKINGRKVS